MKQKIFSIRTKNFDQMRDFYTKTLGLKPRDPVEAAHVEFDPHGNFGAEIHIDHVSRDEDVGHDGFPRLLTNNVEQIAEGLKGRGAIVQIRPRPGSEIVEAFITDPDGTQILLTAEPDK